MEIKGGGVGRAFASSFWLLSWRDPVDDYKEGVMVVYNIKRELCIRKGASTFLKIAMLLQERAACLTRLFSLVWNSCKRPNKFSKVSKTGLLGSRGTQNALQVLSLWDRLISLFYRWGNRVSPHPFHVLVFLKQAVRRLRTHLTRKNAACMTGAILCSTLLHVGHA